MDIEYRLVRVGKRGRVPTMHTKPKDELTANQRKNLNYRLTHADKRREYARRYYEKNKTTILAKMKERYGLQKGN